MAIYSTLDSAGPPVIDELPVRGYHGVVRQWVFDLTIDFTQGVMDYACRECALKEHGGPLGNPGVYSRMNAHLSEAHGVRRADAFHITHIENTRESAEVRFEAKQQSEELVNSAQPPLAPVPLQPESPTQTEWIPKRSVYESFIVDTNCVNARQKSEALNQLEQWAIDGVISLLTAEVAQNEMLAGSDIRRAEKAYTYVFTMSEIASGQERLTLYRIEQILFPGGATNKNQRNDVEIVFNAGKYMRPLITTDGGSKSQPGGILGNAAALSKLRITVLRPDEAVARVRKAIKGRDVTARKMAQLTGEPLPEWVGMD